MNQIWGLGTDIVECLRIAQMIERHGEQFLSRVYTEHEIQYCSSRATATQNFAGRWAAKEAVLKGLGTGWSRGISWRDIEVRHQSGGNPKIRLAGGVRRLCEQHRIADVLISIAHCRNYATATAILLGSE